MSIALRRRRHGATRCRAGESANAAQGRTPPTPPCGGGGARERDAGCQSPMAHEQTSSQYAIVFKDWLLMSKMLPKIRGIICSKALDVCKVEKTANMLKNKSTADNT